MFKFYYSKVFLLFFILAIAAFGCQNTPNTPKTDKSQKVYIEIAVDGMTCGGCEKTVQSALIAIDGVDSAFASHIDKEVRVLVDTNRVSLKEMQEAINDKGYTAGKRIN
jgi:copper chaperone